MAWCEMNQVDFVFGLARNARLVEEISVELLQAEAEASSTGKPVRRFKDILGSQRALLRLRQPQNHLAVAFAEAAPTAIRKANPAQCCCSGRGAHRAALGVMRPRAVKLYVARFAVR
jgi:hypothetical protein